MIEGNAENLFQWFFHVYLAYICRITMLASGGTKGTTEYPGVHVLLEHNTQ